MYNQLGDKLIIFRIIESRNKNFPVGKYVVGSLGWRTHAVGTSEAVAWTQPLEPPYLLPDIGDLPISLVLGVLGAAGWND